MHISSQMAPEKRDSIDNIFEANLVFFPHNTYTPKADKMAKHFAGSYEITVAHDSTIKSYTAYVLISIVFFSYTFLMNKV